MPFDRRQSPWGSEMNVQGLYNGGKQARRSMLEQVQLPGEKFSAGRLEDADESGDLGSSKLQEAGGAVNATHDGEFSGSDARREAMLVDAR